MILESNLASLHICPTLCEFRVRNGEQLRTIFCRLDVTNNGVLSKEELCSVLLGRTDDAAAGQRPPALSRRVVLEAFEHFDADGSGSLEFDEFVVMMHAATELRRDGNSTAAAGDGNGANAPSAAPLMGTVTVESALRTWGT